MRDIEEAIAAGPYDVVLADPPWKYYGSPDKWAAAGKYYPLMSDEEIYALPVRRLLANRAVLFLWTTSTSLRRGFQCFDAWGLHDRGLAFDWIKTRKDGVPLGAQGVRPSITKPLTEQVLKATTFEIDEQDLLDGQEPTEQVLVASTVKKGRPLPLSDERICQTIFAPRSPRGRHSEKPEDVQDRIDRMYPNARKLEMFARRPRPGWSAWGNEA